jgi:hypothetical protein
MSPFRSRTIEMARDAGVNDAPVTGEVRLWTRQAPRSITGATRWSFDQQLEMCRVEFQAADVVRLVATF